MDPDTIAEQLMQKSPLITVTEAERTIPRQPGLYAIFVKSADVLPEPFSKVLRDHNETLIYIGKASVSVQKRLVDQDLRHKNPSTFFRAIGPILGFRPIPGSLNGRSNQNNYKFAASDTRTIIHWINDNLLVRWAVVQNPESYESNLIRQFCPLLNTQHNPKALPALATLRDECRRIACSA